MKPRDHGASWARSLLLAALVAGLPAGCSGSTYEGAMKRAELHLQAREYRQALEACDEALRARPSDRRARLLKVGIVSAWYENAMDRARRHRETRQWAKATEAYREARTVRPGDTGVDQALREWYEDAMTRALKHREARRWTDAADAHREALIAKPGDAEAERLLREQPRIVWPDSAKKVMMEFFPISPGRFRMGSERGEGDEQPAHEVVISRTFWMQATEVTQAQWTAVMGANPSNRKGNDLPVEQVSLEDGREFVRKLGEMVRDQIGDLKVGLPTEAEWEYACRAGGAEAWCFGNEENRLPDYAWYDKNSEGKTHPVAQKKPNAWGLYDMHGNVWEWCADQYDRYRSSSVSDPVGVSPRGSCIVRGGGWLNVAAFTRSAARYWYGPRWRSGSVGLRAVLRP